MPRMRSIMCVDDADPRSYKHFEKKDASNHSKIRRNDPSGSSRTSMHESAAPPTPPRFCRNTRCRPVMADDDGVGDVPTIQTTPSFENYLAAHIQKVHKVIADHTALTTLALHWLTLPMISPPFLTNQVLGIFSSSAFAPPAEVARIILHGNRAVA